MKATLISFCLGAILPGATSLFAETLRIRTPTFSQPGGRQLEILSEAEIAYRPADLIKVDDPRHPFRPNDREYLNLGYSAKVWWVRLRIENETDAAVAAYLMLETYTLNRVDFYFQSANGELIHRMAGDERPLREWTTVPELPLLFPVRLAGRENATVLLRIESPSFLSFPVRILDDQSALVWMSRRNALEGAYVGFLLLSFALLIFLLREIRAALFAWYIVYAIFYFLTYLMEGGHAFVWLWPDAPLWQNRAQFIFMALSGLAALAFAGRFLELKDYFPVQYRIFNLLQILFALYGMLVLVGVDPYLLLRFFAVPFFASGPVILLASLLTGKLRNRSTLYFITAWALTFLFASLNMLVKIGLLPAEPFFIYAGALAFPVELVFLAVSLHRLKLDELSEIGRDVADQNKELLEKLHALSDRPRYKRTQITNIDVDKSVKRLVQLMEEEHVYRVEDLRAAYVAHELGMTFHQFSEFLNRVLKTNFYNLVNEYRIREARQLLTDDPDLQILEIAYRVGFQSKSAFNKAFKERTGMTPRQFRAAGDGARSPE